MKNKWKNTSNFFPFKLNPYKIVDYKGLGDNIVLIRGAKTLERKKLDFIGLKLETRRTIKTLLIIERFY